jgi:hypothetical protein
MSGPPEWLPDIVDFQDCQADTDRIVARAYEYFRRDFVESKPEFRGTMLGLKRLPLDDGKESTFWHLITSGNDAYKRRIELIRCQRIPWVRAIIENANDDAVLQWENVRQGEKRLCLWLERHNYLVILSHRKGYYLLWTAYDVSTRHKQRKLKSEYLNWINSKA